MANGRLTYQNAQTTLEISTGHINQSPFSYHTDVLLERTSMTGRDSWRCHIEVLASVAQEKEAMAHTNLEFSLALSQVGNKEDSWEGINNRGWLLGKLPTDVVSDSLI